MTNTILTVFLDTVYGAMWYQFELSRSFCTDSSRVMKVLPRSGCEKVGQIYTMVH